LSPSSSVEGEEAPVESPNNSPWSGIVNEQIPDNIDDFLVDYFNVDYSTVEQGDLSPNTLQLLNDFTKEFTGNPPPTDNLTNPLQTTEVEHSHTPSIEQCGGGSVDNIQEGANKQFTTFPDFQLSNSILNTIAVYTATFGDPFNSLMGGNFVFDPIEIVHDYVDKIRALLENQIQLWGGRDSIEVSIVLKVFYLNEGKSEVYYHYIHSEMHVIYPNLENF
jgi:hypothetical protein